VTRALSYSRDVSNNMFMGGERATRLLKNTFLKRARAQTAFKTDDKRLSGKRLKLRGKTVKNVRNVQVRTSTTDERNKSNTVFPSHARRRVATIFQCVVSSSVYSLHRRVGNYHCRDTTTHSEYIQITRHSRRNRS